LIDRKYNLSLIYVRSRRIISKTYMCIAEIQSKLNQNLHMCAAEYLLSNIVCYTKTSNHPYRQQCYSKHCYSILKAMFTILLTPYGWSKVLSIAFSPNLEKCLSYSHSVFGTELLQLKKQILKSDHLRYSPFIHPRNASYYWHNTNSGIYSIEKHFFKRMSE
jgi:hypothetical protein